MIFAVKKKLDLKYQLKDILECLVKYIKRGYLLVLLIFNIAHTSASYLEVTVGSDVCRVHLNLAPNYRLV